jgi:hypothetical protein
MGRPPKYGAPVPQTADDLANAAANDPTVARVGGLMCHDSVATWLVQAGFIDRTLFQTIYASEAVPHVFYKKILARPTDTRARRADSAQVPQGSICGFYDGQGRLHHSMVAVTAGVFAGTNNGGVGGNLGYMQMRHDQFTWNADNETVGSAPFLLYYCGVDDFKYRYAEVCALFAASL